MNCSNCGAPIPEGASFCVNCGAQVTQPADTAYNAFNQQSTSSFSLAGQQTSPQSNLEPYQDPFQRPLQDTYQQPYQSNVHVAPSASSTTKIIAVVALLAVAGVIVFFLLKGGPGVNKNGDYKCIEMQYMGITYDEAMIESTGQNVVLKVKDNTCEINGEKGEIKFKGSKVEITDADGTYTGTYDKKEETITLEIQEFTFVFKKQ